MNKKESSTRLAPTLYVQLFVLEPTRDAYLEVRPYDTLALALLIRWSV